MHELELFDFLEHTADAACAVTDEGEICSWNASAESLFGYSRTDVLGKTCFELFGGTGALGARACTERRPSEGKSPAAVVALRRQLI